MIRSLIFLLSLTVSVVSAQTFNNFFSASWNVNQPLSGGDVLDDVSLRGVKLGFRKLLAERYLIGADFSSATYDDFIPRRTYPSDNGAITTSFFPHAYAYGLTLAGDYLFNVDKRFNPYIGVGAGVSYIDYTLFYNVFSTSDTEWGFLARPQVGFIIRMGTREAWGIQAAVHYEISTASNERLGFDAFSNVGAQLGVVLFAR